MTGRDSKPSRPTMWCMNCGYALDGLSENRCPECGRRFDPRKRRTFRRSPRLLSVPFLRLLYLTAIVVGIWIVSHYRTFGFQVKYQHDTLIVLSEKGTVNIANGWISYPSSYDFSESAIRFYASSRPLLEDQFAHGFSMTKSSTNGRNQVWRASFPHVLFIIPLLVLLGVWFLRIAIASRR
jgi:hypothetical protein